ncbi:MAG TPA: glycosyltransferase family 2 protein [Thermoanaerobaculia bacterium]|nr:glycosyltransferase family 2 protein [Thermoanaerobaculia bacterium]
MPFPAESVSVIVVNFNGGEKVTRCVEALLATAPGADVVVIDNASTDGSAEGLERSAGRVRLVRNRENAGYAAALNQGAKSSARDVLVFLNMDVEPEREWLEPLMTFLAEHEHVGAINPLIVLADGERINAAGQRIHVTGLGFNRSLGAPVVTAGIEPFEVTGIQGAAFAMRREVYEHIGGFDESGFLYHEDVNLSWLLRLAGYRLYCVPRSRVRHDYVLSMYAEKFHLLERNRLAMLLAYLRWRTFVMLAPMLALTELFGWIYAVIRGHGLPGAKARAYGWVVRRRATIAQRRRVGRTLRRIGDAELLRALHWRYEWGQFASLAQERGEARRKPVATLPLDR